MIQRTLVLLKPDAVQRCVSGEITTRFEKAGMKIVGMKMVWVDKDFCLRIIIFKVLYIINSYSMVSGAVAWPEDKVFFCEALNIVTKVLIRDEDNIIGVKAFNDLDAVS